MDAKNEIKYGGANLDRVLRQKPLWESDFLAEAWITTKGWTSGTDHSRQKE